MKFKTLILAAITFFLIPILTQIVVLLIGLTQLSSTVSTLLTISQIIGYIFVALFGVQFADMLDDLKVPKKE